MKGTTVDLLVPHRLHRWVLPAGFLGVAALAVVAMALPRDQGATVFWIGRIVVVTAYLGFAGVALSRTRRVATVYVDASGLREGDTLLVDRSSIERVLASRKNERTTIEVRGKTPLALELTSVTDAETLVAALDPGRDRATVSFLATTTPVYVMVLAWMGIPVVLSLPLQFMLGPHTTMVTLLAYAIPCGALWLGTSWWFMRRRRVTVTTEHIELPRLFSTQADVILLSELTSVALRDPFTVELRFASRRPRRLKIYDPALVSELVDRLKARARVQVLDLAKR